LFFIFPLIFFSSKNKHYRRYSPQIINNTYPKTESVLNDNTSDKFVAQFCSNCGSKFGSGDIFCSTCGYKID
jgi:uncharacterized OB-fold protein